jgi:hypothetical protein
MSPPAPTTARALLAGTAASLVLTGCAGAETPPVAVAAPPATAAPPSAEPAPSPPPAPPTAANGTDVAACADGTCEVLVTPPVTFPTDPRFGVSAIAADSVRGDEIFLGIAFPGGEFSFDCRGDDRCGSQIVGATAGSPATAGVTGHPGAVITINRITITVVWALNGSAVLRLAPA